MKLSIPDMSCGHCVASIEKTVRAADPAASVQADLASHTAEIDATVSPDMLQHLLAEAGYPSTVVESEGAT